MKAHVTGIAHVNLLVSRARLERVTQFYVEAIGLTLGARPESGTPGAWLYCGEHPVIHLSAKASDEGVAMLASRERIEPGFDHIAFEARGGAEYRKRLESLGITFSELQRPSSYQILLVDPDGTRVELNFVPEDFQ
jgi:glyoxylase I family protein